MERLVIYSRPVAGSSLYSQYNSVSRDPVAAWISGPVFGILENLSSSINNEVVPIANHMFDNWEKYKVREEVVAGNTLFLSSSFYDDTLKRPKSFFDLALELDNNLGIFTEDLSIAMREVTSLTGFTPITSFTGFSDTPNNYVGAAGKIVQVATSGTAFEFVTYSKKTSFLSLDNTPGSFDGSGMPVESTTTGVSFLDVADSRAHMRSVFVDMTANGADSTNTAYVSDTEFRIYRLDIGNTGSDFELHLETASGFSAEIARFGVIVTAGSADPADTKVLQGTGEWAIDDALWSGYTLNSENAFYFIYCSGQGFYTQEVYLGTTFF